MIKLISKIGTRKKIIPNNSVFAAGLKEMSLIIKSLKYQNQSESQHKKRFKELKISNVP